MCIQKMQTQRKGLRMSFLEEQVNLLRLQEWLSGRTEAWVCSRSLVGIEGSNQAGVWVCLLSVLCVVR